MPYDTLKELPDAVRENLPKHAQEIYQKAFNSAWEDYKNPEDRDSDASHEEVAHKVAWSAVKQKYQKGDDEKWHRRD